MRTFSCRYAGKLGRSRACPVQLCSNKKSFYAACRCRGKNCGDIGRFGGISCDWKIHRFTDATNRFEQISQICESARKNRCPFGAAKEFTSGDCGGIWGIKGCHYRLVVFLIIFHLYKLLKSSIIFSKSGRLL